MDGVLRTACDCGFFFGHVNSYRSKPHCRGDKAFLGARSIARLTGGPHGGFCRFGVYTVFEQGGMDGLVIASNAQLSLRAEGVHDDACVWWRRSAILE
jgi:hypothetical protein